MNPKDKHADWLLKPTANQLADEVEMWGKDLLALNMKGGIPVIEGAKLLRQQQSLIKQLEETQEYLYKTHDKDKAQLAAAEQYCLDAFERGKQIGYADGIMNRKAQEK